MVKFSAFGAFALISLASQALAQRTVKVMPFGASIVSKCWRANLQAKLKNDGIRNFDFVGSLGGNCGGNGVDQDHEGHSGSQATDYAKNGNLTVWLDRNPPDVVIMLLGTNDVLLGKKPVKDILAAYDVLLGQMRAKNARMQIIFSNLLPLDPARWPKEGVEGMKALNSAIATYAPKKSTVQSPVYFVDNYADFNAVTDTTDGEHPNDVGSEKMAKKFFGPTKNAIQVVGRSSRILKSKRTTGWARREVAAKAANGGA
ncbi:carbohydrate esterase family 3 protein [Cucurbitaria berberidis CBS 394.84]|uniref:Carbohydrate esterase family 3 protein n=1 Tax=Cucurbitaria berberidis CBS 394.84 TaxID=1168544 RepID=A0A9P4GKI4_9PLEO|nr:carbohydrate esterase family 3 protein [Cucurbitaria berberidis CBS 394.84]KAF1846791.1 carbohydrate esterase family 3 protein [Cucurbitaria berberidis CBS 394.84]